MSASKEPMSRLGFFLAVGAFAIWGVAPLYWKMLKDVPAEVTLFHRVMWTALLLAVLLTFKAAWPPHLASLRKPSMLLSLLVSAALIGSNWFTFIHAINSNRILATSLGYFINPLLTVFLAVLLLKENLPNLQKGAIGLALLALTILTIRLGEVPVIALVLALTFGGYSLVRKVRPIDPIFGLMLEALAVGVVLFCSRLATADTAKFFDMSLELYLLQFGSGVLTVTPLLMFGIAIKKLPLSMTGFLQFIAPCGSFLLGVFYYHEPFTSAHFSAYGLIWVALGIFTYSRFRSS